jgi:hypothetical protein
MHKIPFFDEAPGLTQFLADNGVNVFYRDGDYYADTDAETYAQFVGQFNPLPVAKADALMQLVGDCERAMQKATAGTPESERISWPTKYEAALRHTVQNPQPIIVAEASARGEPESELVALILANAQLYNALVGTVSAIRRKARDEINEAETLQAVTQALGQARAALYALQEQ